MSSRKTIFVNEDTSIMSDSVRDQIPFACCLLIVMAVLGSVGNSLVLGVYSRKSDKQTASLFILILAIADLTTCVVIIPFTIVNEMLLWRIGSEALCKTYFVLNASSIPFSSLLISAIAVDRFLCICYPFLRAMTVPRAKVLVLVLAGVSLMLGSLAAWFAHMYVKPPPGAQNATLLEGNFSWTTLHPAHEDHVDPQPECTSRPHKSHPQKIFFTAIQKANHFCFALCIVCVVVLYILIYRSILQIRKRRCEKLGLKHKPVLNSNNNHDNNNHNHIDKKQTNKNNTKDNTVTNKFTRSLRKSLAHSVANQHRETNNLLIQNMKTAAILFVVAVVFIVTFVPALLMASDLLKLNLMGFYLYYLNNAANPIIYCFMNPTFREEVHKLFCPISTSSSSTAAGKPIQLPLAMEDDAIHMDEDDIKEEEDKVQEIVPIMQETLL